MPPKNNDFPLDQIASTPAGSVPPVPPTVPAASEEPVTNVVPGGTTFTPQSAPGVTPVTPPTDTMPPVPTADPSSLPSTPAPTAPSFQQDAQTDAAALYTPPAVPGSEPTPAPPDPTTAMHQDFSAAQNIGTTTAPPSPLASPEPIAPAPTPVATPTEPPVPQANTLDLSGGAAPAPAPLATPEAPAPAPTDTYGSSAMTGAPHPSALPGAEQLAAANANLAGVPPAPVGSSDPLLAGIDPLTADMPGSYGPPPKNNKKMIFIILGIVVGIILVAIVVVVLARSTAKKPAVNLSETIQTTETVVPTSGPATPPEGYVTIEKQCYSFAIYATNTIPADQVCTFANATYGKFATSKISVTTGTTEFKTLDEYVATVKPTITVTNDEVAKLDTFAARKLTYTASDGKTYVKVLALVTGKNYQQDGKTIATVDLTSSYQDAFDQQVTNTVIDTWRWK